MKDYIVRAIADNGNIRAFAATTKILVEEARNIHNTTPVATAALGRTLTVGAIMGIMLKGEKGSITVQIKGDGPLGGIVAISDSKANVRGYVYNPGVELPSNNKRKLDVSKAIGKGYLNIIADLGLKEPYSGQVPLVSGEIAEDIAYYFQKSEQINSAVGLGVLVEKDYSVAVSGGFIIQAMPGIEDETTKKVEEKIKSITSVTALFKQLGSPENVLEYLLNGLEMSQTDKVPTRYLCTCSRDRIERALISLGRTELNSLIKEQGQAELTCHFCDKNYCFNKDELEKLHKEASK